VKVEGTCVAGASPLSPSLFGIILLVLKDFLANFVVTCTLKDR
jgi:hypothetical protein